MTKEKEDYLFETFPNLFPNGRKADMQVSLMRFGFPGDGWFDLIKDLCEKITAEGISITVMQVKEKFGGLRFYFDMNAGTTQEQYTRVNELVVEAEAKSEVTCEDCGQPGKIRSGSWIRCLCDEHSDGKPAWEMPTE